MRRPMWGRPRWCGGAGASLKQPSSAPTGSAPATPAAVASSYGRLLQTVAIVVAAILVAIVMAMPWSPIATIFGYPKSDFRVHANVARDIAKNGITIPHFLWHLLAIAVHKALPSTSWMGASFIVVIASYALQGAALAWVSTTAVAEPRRGVDVVGVVVLSLLLVIVAPVTILTWPRKQFYFGYLNMESYLSPTQALLKPIALVVFALTAKLFANTDTGRERMTLAVCVVLASMAKPSLTICLVPATIVLGLWYRLSGRPIHLGHLVGAILAPAAAILMWQYGVYFGAAGRSSIIFAPFAVMGRSRGMFPRFVMSLLLPLTVLLVYRRRLLEDAAMKLAWVLFAFAAAYTYLLAETRETIAGNFAWAGQIGTYLLFVASTVFVLRNWTGLRRSGLCGIAFGLHVVCGIVYFFMAVLYFVA
jgi:hypothetical protein